MIAYKLCHTNYVLDDDKYGNIPGVTYKTFEFPFTQKDPDDKNNEITVKRKYKFAQDDEGLLPGILTRLWSGRKIVKKQMINEKDIGKKSMLNGKQLAIKVSMNSIYGFCGAAIGRYPLLAIADVTTYMGRESIKSCQKMAEENFDCKVIYGDSVSADTPILIREKETGFIDVVQISTIPWNGLNHENAYKRKWLVRSDGKEYSEENIDSIQIWTDMGWTDIKQIIRHKIPKNKKMYRVTTNVGIIDVTEDHSLLDDSGKEITPENIREEEDNDNIRLMSSRLPKSNNSSYLITKKDVCDRATFIKSFFIL